MNAKKWTAAEIRKLADLAKAKGYNKGVLAAFIGVTPATLSVWMADGRGELPLTSRNALMWIENEMKDLPDVPKPKGATKKRGDDN
jgi:hypothetical protein